MESVVRFRNASGHELQGILHRPERLDVGAPALVWLPAGQKVRQGAWRMNVVVARRMAAMGFPVLRFDYEGMGDSEGPRRHGEYVMEFYGFVQTGGFRGDVIAAVNFALGELGPRPVVLGGLCGGAASALFAGAELGDRVWGHVLIDLPVTISSAARQRYLEEHPEDLVRARPAEADTVLLLYAKKILDVEAWKRLARGESNPRLFAEALRVKARTRVDAALPRLPAAARLVADKLLGPAVGEAAEGSAQRTDVGEKEAARGEVRNELIVPTFREVLAKGQRVRFINSSSYDPTFRGYFGVAELGEDPAAWRARGFDLVVAPDTNHIFSLEHSQKHLFDAVERALRDARA
ncbi:MAG: hypothetical protein U0326_39940 [Polyangiales bacterium]